MNAVESVRMSWRAIRDHPLRSVLTTLGIVIGIGAVITFVTLGTSLQAAVIGDVAGETTPEMTVTVAPAGQNGPGGTSAPVFTERDLSNLRAIENVDRVVPSGTVSTSALERGDERIAWQGVTATTPEGVEDRPYESGRAFRQGEREVVVNRAAASLFSPNLTVGETITVRLGRDRSVDATVVGIVNGSDRGVFGPPGSSARIFVPTDPFYDATVESPATGTEQRAYPDVTVRATGFDTVDGVERDVRAYLGNESDARELKPDSFEIRVQTNEQLVEQIQGILDTFTGFVTGIAVLSLVVGSIGIANIMLVSVTERTREIGIMKAIGAQNRDVLQLFLVESMILGAIGAVVGTVLGIAGGYAAAELIGLPVVFAVEWFGISIAVGVGVGVVAGLYPAWNAARVDPIDALRRE